ncbi:hypothetical protein HGM15179_011387 [Zosterops borbonicus]|uniref:Uncharacterized protein n=1 Tax=Zosterops borbonicus TaxID=364589 RepID=A0A8K1GCQ0_9PASS|nr:hypothetical protein HGM15179_011387 [Zosterops borbonicus]
MEVNGGAEIHLQCMEETHTRALDVTQQAGKPVMEQTPVRTCESIKRGVHAEAGVLSELFPGDCTPRKETLGGAVSEELDCLPWERLHTGAREECEESDP